MGTKAVLAAVLASSLTAGLVWTAPVRATVDDVPADYEPTPESLSRHSSPEWFNDAKLGFFIHWGPYSVPAYAPETGGARDGSAQYAEWYWYEMNHPGSPTYEHHAETYGEDFPYDRFIEQWKPTKFDPREWLDLFVEGGAKYFVLTSKHHDGVALWDTDTTDRDTVALGPQRDLVSELFTAAEDYPLKKGLYYSLAEWYNPAGGWVPPRGHSLEEGPVNPYTGEAVPYTGYTPIDDDVMDQQYPQMLELVDRFDPDIMWCDIGEHVPNNSNEFTAYYFNQAKNRPQPKEVTVNDRCGTETSDFTTPEYRSQPEIDPEKWEATRGIGRSFGYNKEEDVEDYLTSEDLIHSFVDTVSKNGNLLLNIGPKADGSIPDIQAERVRALGDWLDVNGEAIYGSTYWAHADDSRSNVPVRYTVQDDAMYATALQWPGEELVLSGDLPLAPSSRITLLGSDGESLPWHRANGQVVVDMPEQGADATPSEYAFTFKISTPGQQQTLHTALDVPSQPEPGEPLTARVTVTNPGPRTSPTTRVRLNIPDGWTADPVRRILGRLAPGESREIVFTVTPQEQAEPRRYTLTADIDAGRVSYQPSDAILLSDLVQVVKPDKLKAIDIAEPGTRAYVDRNWAISELPAELSGDVLIPGANDDKQRQSGAMSLVDGRARVRGGDVTLAAGGHEWTDYTFEVTVRPGTRGAGWVFRSPDRRNGYMWQLYPGTGLTPHVLRDGTFSRLDETIPLDVSTGTDYHVRMELRGSTIRTFVDGTLVDERVDTTFSQGTVGFREASNEIAEFDDVRVVGEAGDVLLADDFSGGLDQWANDSQADYLAFDLTRDASVYLAFDERGGPDRGDWWPSWLDELGFERTDMIVRTDDPSGPRMVVFRADIPAGRVVLGPNSATSDSSSSYLTIVGERTTS
jgi:alpha-L-fucosidase